MAVVRAWWLRISRSAPALLIAANVAVFVVLVVGSLVAGSRSWVAAFELPPSLAALLSRPWSLVSYMFAQVDVLHLLFNMLWLYCFARLLENVYGMRRIIAVYLAGGLAGGLTFVLLSPVLPGAVGGLLGSSAAVLALGVAAAVRMPDLRLSLFLFGEVRLRWVVLVMVVLLCVSGASSNLGGIIAHLGGAAAGAVYVFAADRVGRRRVSRRHRPVTEAEFDSLLDKVRRSGFASLTASERRRLFEYSSYIKKK